MEESKSECVHKSINKKYSNNEIDHEEPLVMNNPVVKEPSYLNIFECGKNIFNRLDATREQACMEKSRDKYYNGLLRTIKYCNERNNSPLFNKKIQESMHKVISERNRMPIT